MKKSTLNARIIDAAPDLYKALIKITELENTEYNEWDAVERLIPEIMSIANDAISKVKT